MGIASKPCDIMRKCFRLFVLWFLMGAAYFTIEILWRIPKGQFPHWSMWIVGGLCGVMVGAINQIPRFFNMPVWKQSIIGTLITLAVEFAAGCILNLWLDLGVWDYSHLWGNLLGQICVLFAFAWFLLMPLAIWLEDTLRWGFGWNCKAYSLKQIYWDLVSLR